MNDATSIMDALGAALPRLGFDLSAALQVGWYNETVEPRYRLPDDGRPTRLAVLIGNSRALWPAFLEAMSEDDALFASPHPIDEYTVTRLETVVDGLGIDAGLRYAFEPPPRRVAVQAMAEVAGLAARSPTFQSVHPVYGPWIAFRAVLLTDVEGPPARPDAPIKTCDCERCCRPALDAALEATRDIPFDEIDPRDHWRLWLAVREACPVGRDERYSDEQIAYHYTKDLDRLRRLSRRSHPR